MLKDSKSSDLKYMKMALRLAKKAVGVVSPNPLVGAVIVKNGKVIATGYHKGYKQLHAEAEAINKAGRKARGATIFVTLEPCCHVGSNPACTDLILNAGIAKVVYAVDDPNPKVRNCISKNILEKNGVLVEKGVLEAEAKEQNRFFLKHITQNKPYVTIKLAQTLDGKIADRFGKSQWITGEAIRQKVHELRYEHDAILVGSNTVITDNPSLTVRLPNKGKTITKIVLDPALIISPKSKIFESGERVVIVTRAGNEITRTTFPKQTEFIEHKEAEFNLENVLSELYLLGICSVFVEGGSKVATSFFEQKQVDRLVMCFGAMIAEDKEAVSGLSSATKACIENFKKLKLISSGIFHSDVLLEYDVQQ